MVRLRDGNAIPIRVAPGERLQACADGIVEVMRSAYRPPKGLQLSAGRCRTSAVPGKLPLKLSLVVESDAALQSRQHVEFEASRDFGREKVTYD